MCNKHSTVLVLRDRRAISNMHNYYYCTPERRGYWSRLSAIHEKPVVVRLESALTSDFPEQRHDSFPKTEIKGNIHRCSNSIRVNAIAS